jgi:hypothetical protein
MAACLCLDLPMATNTLAEATTQGETTTVSVHIALLAMTHDRILSLHGAIIWE